MKTKINENVVGWGEKPQHTPTPWKVAESGTWIGGTDNVNSFKAGFLQEIAELRDHHGRGRANAAFIVRAVNAHEELLVILKMVLGYEGLLVDHQGFKKVIEQAIAKAEQSSTGSPTEGK